MHQPSQLWPARPHHNCAQIAHTTHYPTLAAWAHNQTLHASPQGGGTDVLMHAQRRVCIMELLLLAAHGHRLPHTLRRSSSFQLVSGSLIQFRPENKGSFFPSQLVYICQWFRQCNRVSVFDFLVRTSCSQGTAHIHHNLSNFQLFLRSRPICCRI